MGELRTQGDYFGGDGNDIITGFTSVRKVG